MRVLQTTRLFFVVRPGQLEPPESYIRTWLTDVSQHMKSKIDPLCVLAAITIDPNEALRASYEALEAEFKQGWRRDIKLWHGRAAACEKVLAEFEHAVGAWFQGYERCLGGAEV